MADHMARADALLALAVAAASCGSGVLVTEDVCTPGGYRACSCPDGSESGQVCASDGSRWEACICGEPEARCEDVVCPAGWYCDPEGAICRMPSEGDADADADSDPDGGDDASSCEEATFVLSESRDSFVVPEDALYMHVKVWGAGGNGEAGCTGDADNGGPGGFAEAVFEAEPGAHLDVIVGLRGQAGASWDDPVRSGFGARGGGGLSGVFRAPTPITERDSSRALVVAGGGGSAGAPGCLPGGPGNHAAAGGETTMQGSPGADEINGGGGGSAGGSGGARGEPARGGTGRVASEALLARVLSSEPGVERRPPRADDPDYDGSAGTTETSGLVVARFLCRLPGAL